MYIYQKSIKKLGTTEYFICKTDNKKFLAIKGADENSNKFKGIQKGETKFCEFSAYNAAILIELFPFAKPVRNLKKDISIGLGDRLGLASPGHIRVIENHNIFPILAQQSIRELNLTSRTYEDVLAKAVFAVFQEGYEDGYGADGDHLKTAEEVNYALDCGFTMITLDCSEHIINDINNADKIYGALDTNITKALEKKYLDKKFTLKSGATITFDIDSLIKAVVMYSKAIDHTYSIFSNVIQKKNADIDFEISIDETLSTTTPQDHYFVAKELLDLGIEFTSLAPRFCGEFQKGIDYIGNTEDFKKEFAIHAQIANTLGYKISVHSGSDKFEVFPYVGEYTDMKFHLKTAGTNWLEAIRVTAVYDPKLYRDIHRFALENIKEAQKYYHIGAKIENIQDLSKIEDIDLPKLLTKNDSRQLIHITYGLILQNEDLGVRIFEFLNTHEEEYYDALIKHIGKHISALGI